MNPHATLPVELLTLLPPPLQAAVEPVVLERGKTLFVQGARPVALFYVVCGEMVLERAGLQGQTVVLQRVRRGFVAEASMQSSRYHCSGLATVAGQACRLPMPLLKAALQDDSRFAVRWIGMLNDEVRRLRAQTERLSLKGVEARLLHLIETEGRSGRLAIESGLKSLSAQLGVTHEALYRTVAALERQGRLARRDAVLLLR
jgi:CRP-like cAMP-binding protein